MILLTSDSATAVDNLTEAATEATSNVKTGVFQQWLEDQVPKLVSFATLVVLALIVWIVGVRVIAFLRRLVKKSLVRHDVEVGIQTFVDGCLKAVSYIILIACVLRVFGIEATSLAAVVASLGVTAGLALQGSLSNFAGGVLILILKPFVVGDYIIEDTHKNEGTVFEISIFYTKLKTIDNQIVVIPNGTLANSSLTNVTHADRRLEDFAIGISYDDDIRTAKKVLMDLAKKEEKRIPESEPKVFVKELGDSSVVLALRFEAKTEDYWDVRFRMLEEIKYAIEEAGLHIPYPQLDVHTDK